MMWISTYSVWGLVFYMINIRRDDGCFETLAVKLTSEEMELLK